MSRGRQPQKKDSGLDFEVLRRRREIALIVLAILVVLGAGGTTAWYVLRAPRVVTADLIAAAHEAVEEAIGPGVTIQFAGPGETQIVKAGPQSYDVSADLLTISRAGEALSYRFECALVRQSDGRWGAAKLELKPR